MALFLEAGENPDYDCPVWITHKGLQGEGTQSFTGFNVLVGESEDPEVPVKASQHFSEVF